MVEFNNTLWAPWRKTYMTMLGEKIDGCFLCHAAAHPEQDETTHLLRRGAKCFVILNRFPYTTGHLLVSPYCHTGLFAELDDETYLEMMQLTRDMQALLARLFRAEGFNVGINVGRCAGAGLPDHLHLHIVPRWPGDTNFVSVIGDIRVIPDDIDELYRRLRAEPEARPA